MIKFFISFFLLTDLDAVFNGPYWSLFVKLQHIFEIEMEKTNSENCQYCVHLQK